VSELETIRGLARGALAALEASRQRIDDLNVYPVPDGDTGTNLTLTARGVVEALEASSAADRQALAREVTRAALMSARGNSGVILSQIVRGAADVLAAEVDVSKAFRGASDEAYAAVRKPVEGTMLTVIRELAEAAEAAPPLEPAELLALLVERGEESVARTPEQLDVLREAGVVDAGGAGLVELVGLADDVGEPADDLRQDHARVAACAHERRPRELLRESGAVVRLRLLERLDDRARGEREVRPGVAVGDGIDVEVVDSRAARLEGGERPACELERGHPAFTS